MSERNWAQISVSVKAGLLDQQAVARGIGRRTWESFLAVRAGMLISVEVAMSLLLFQ